MRSSFLYNFLSNTKINQLETFWAQHSRIQWLQLGDRNTKFFQTVAKLHSRHNHIHELHTSNGNIVTS